MIIRLTSGKGEACAEILATLPHWFGIPQSNAAYVRDVVTMPFFAAVEGTTLQGFLAIKHHSPYASEIYVLGVRAELHRRGIGRELVSAAEVSERERGARFLTVKTRSPSRPDPGYLKTLAFYEGVGFVALEEFPTLWNPENPALMLVKALV